MKAYTGFESNGYDADSSGFADLTTKENTKSDDAHQNVFKGKLILNNHKGKGVVGIANDDHPSFELTLWKSFEGGSHPTTRRKNPISELSNTNEPPEIAIDKNDKPSG